MTTINPRMLGTLDLKNVDRVVLPASLLPQAKQQSRVKYSEDDEDIKNRVARAIAWVEANADLQINPAAWEWSLAGIPRPSWGYPWWYGASPLDLPVRPVISVTVLDGAGDNVTQYWQLSSRTDAAGVKRSALTRVDVAVSQWPVTVTMQTGYPTLDAMPPLIIDAVLRYAAHLYENREATAAQQLYTAPDFARSVLGPLWQPRV
jgi:uncharacterized phiE125 gp8 family phage protein